MKRKSHVISLACLVALFLNPAHTSAEVSECPVTIADNSAITFDTPLKTNGFMGWHGSNQLAALIPSNGKWYFMGPEHNYRNKFWWAHESYDASAEPRPPITISAKRLDAPADPVYRDNATHGRGIDSKWQAMLIGMEFPTAGCWEVTGRYHEHSLTMVFQVGE
ncbi:MAG: hypothetical protein AAF431_14725 [Pseudomonadota bacterium]